MNLSHPKISIVNCRKKNQYSLHIFICFLFFLAGFANAQTIIVSGTVADVSTNRPLVNARVNLLKTTFSAYSDSNGNFSISISEPGFYTLSAEKEKYITTFSSEYLFTFSKSPFVPIQMEPVGENTGEAVITKSGLQIRKAESPVSAQQISIREIERNPGGNRNISKIVQSLPGVISIPGFRNDIIIRGGAPSENKFYLEFI